MPAAYAEPRRTGRPFSLTMPPQCLQGIVVAVGEAMIDHLPCHTRPARWHKRSAALRMARSARLVATGCFCTNSLLPAPVKQLDPHVAYHQGEMIVVNLVGAAMPLREGYSQAD